LTYFEPILGDGYNTGAVDYSNLFCHVSFPDFPGCVTFGKTFEELKAKGREALELWLEELASQIFLSFPCTRESRPFKKWLNTRFPRSLTSTPNQVDGRL